jgi:hypothetical protein
MKKRLLALGLAGVLLGGAALWVPGDISWGADDFFVVAASQFQRNGSNIYYTAGNVGIGTNNPISPLHIQSNSRSILAQASAASTTVIEGLSTATSGGGWGMYGKSFSTDSATAYGVYGEATGLGAGVRGFNNSTSGYGVSGENSAAVGTGIYGLNSTTNGGGIGVKGTAQSGVGVDGDGNIGVSGSGSLYGVLCSGNFGVFNGTKNAIVPTSQGNRKTYSQESPEVWFEDTGEGQLAGGLAHIALDPLFLETVTINDQHPMKVFIQLNDDCNGVYVQRQAKGFRVKELRGGNSGAHFTYRVMAKRKGFETARLEAAGDIPMVAGLKAPKQ